MAMQRKGVSAWSQATWTMTIGPHGTVQSTDQWNQMKRSSQLILFEIIMPLGKSAEFFYNTHPVNLLN